MRKLFKLSPAQWKVLSSAFSNMGQAVILFSLAAFFVPEAVSLSKDFSRAFAILILTYGLFMLIAGVIMSKKVK